MTKRTGCPILLSLWSYVIITLTWRAQIAYDLNNPNPAPEDVIHFVDTFDEWMATSIIRIEETSRDLIDSSVTNIDALWSEVSGTTADENRLALAESHFGTFEYAKLRINYRFLVLKMSNLPNKSSCKKVRIIPRTLCVTRSISAKASPTCT